MCPFACLSEWLSELFAGGDSSHPSETHMAGRTHGGSRKSRNLETRRSRWLNPVQEHADPSSQQTQTKKGTPTFSHAKKAKREGTKRGKAKRGHPLFQIAGRFPHAVRNLGSLSRIRRGACIWRRSGRLVRTGTRSSLQRRHRRAVSPLRRGRLHAHQKNATASLP